MLVLTHVFSKTRLFEHTSFRTHVFSNTRDVFLVTQVMEACHLPSNTHLAVKTMDLRMARMRQRNDPMVKIRKEMKIQASLKHPNIVRLYTWFEEPSFAYMVMEWVKGGDLFDFLAEMSTEQVSEEQAKFMFRQLLKGVEYLHARDIVHRDLKPENVMLADKSERPRLKITDFGQDAHQKSALLFN